MGPLTSGKLRTGPVPFGSGLPRVWGPISISGRNRDFGPRGSPVARAGRLRSLGPWVGRFGPEEGSFGPGGPGSGRLPPEGWFIARFSLVPAFWDGFPFLGWAPRFGTPPGAGPLVWPGGPLGVSPRGARLFWVSLASQRATEPNCSKPGRIGSGL